MPPGSSGNGALANITLDIIFEGQAICGPAREAAGRYRGHRFSIEVQSPLDVLSLPDATLCLRSDVTVHVGFPEHAQQHPAVGEFGGPDRPRITAYAESFGQLDEAVIGFSPCVQPTIG